MDLLEKPKQVGAMVASVAVLTWMLTHQKEFEKRAKAQADVYTEGIKALMEKSE